MIKQHVILLFFTIGFLAVKSSVLAQSATNIDLQNRISDEKKISLDAGLLKIPEGFTKNLRWNLPLDPAGKNGSVISWKSGNPAYISNEGKLLKRSPRKGKKVNVTLTATLSAGRVKRNKVFTVDVAFEEQPLDGYLFAYFEGSGEAKKQEQLRFGVSADAVNWFALNNNQPVIASDEISQTGGIRDPHILRGEDEKTFYLAATDMFTVKNGWEHNPGIDLLKSTDLINWSHGIIDLAKTYPQKFANVKWVWAPQTIYDPSAGKYLVYFTVRFQDDPRLDFYCAYANADFTAFEQEPQLILPAKYGAIDGDIIYKDGVYHFFYKGNTKDENGKETQNGIQQATGKTLQGPWTETFKYADSYSEKHVSVEGSGVFKLNKSDEYILMYDLYRDHRYEFQRSIDLYNFTQTPQSFTKNFNPRHGTVLGITREEAIRLNNKWGGVPEQLLKISEAKNK